MPYFESTGGGSTPAPNRPTNETLVLAAIPADTWTNFPAPVVLAQIDDFRIFHQTGVDITDSVDVRRVAGQLQVRSSLALTNVTFTYEGK